MFALYTSQTYFHTDNLYLTNSNASHDGAWVGAFGLSFIPYSTYRWMPRISIEGVLVRFARGSMGDYNGQTIGFDNRFGLTDDNLLSWNLGASALRLEGEQASLGEFYRRVEIVNALSWFKPFRPNGRWLLHASPSVSWRTAHPAAEDRLDASAYLGVLWISGRAVALEPFVEAGYAYYPNDSPTLQHRRDLHIRAGVSAFWTLTEHASVGAVIYWLGNYSSAAGGDYQILPNATLSFRFTF